MSILAPLDQDGLIALDDFFKREEPRCSGMSRLSRRESTSSTGPAVQTAPLPPTPCAMTADMVGVSQGAAPMQFDFPLYDPTAFPLPTIDAMPGFSPESTTSPVSSKKRRLDSTPGRAEHDPARDRVSWVPNDRVTLHRIFDHAMEEIPSPGFRVEVDKGMKRSHSDSAWICQKKNHFQVTVTLKLRDLPACVATRTGLLKVSELCLDLYGIRTENPSSRIQIVQSAANRSKKTLAPIAVTKEHLQEDISKITIGRLHFSETTANNMRKKGKRHPDQRHFALVVALCAKVGDELYPIASHVSDNLIVRASNPAQFDTDQSKWESGAGTTIFHHGSVAINTEHATEAFVVNGNARITGTILQPSDRRLKRNIRRTCSESQLANIMKLGIYEYDFEESWVEENNIQPSDVGVLAQELSQVIPTAVRKSGMSVDLSEGEKIDDLLVVDKDRLFMEAVGAMQALATQVEQLQLRVEELEERVKPAPSAVISSWMDDALVSVTRTMLSTVGLC